jgi:hypothetical protein
MSTSTPLSRLAEQLQRPFRRDGRPTRLHPAALWSEAVGTAGLALAPAWSKVRDLWLKYVWPVLSVVSILGWSVLAAAILLWSVGQAYGWQEAKAAAVAAFVLFVIAIGFIMGRSSYGVVLDLARTRVAVGDSAVGSIAVSNTSTRPLLPAALELPVGAATAVFHLPRMKPAADPARATVRGWT